MGRKKGPHWHGHRARLRERFRRAGEVALADYELLELLLTYAIPRRDVKPQAKVLLERFGSLAGVLAAPEDELQQVEGIGPSASLLIRLVKELGAASLAGELKGRDLVNSPERVVAFARMKFGGEREEHFAVLYLNAKNELIDVEVMQRGTVDRAVVYPRQVAEGALRRGASGVILLHNHPSGHPDPSPEDRALTGQVAMALRPLEIRLLDHLIVAQGGHFSFREKGLL